MITGETGRVPLEAGSDVSAALRPDRGALLPELGRLHDHDRAAYLHQHRAALPAQNGETRSIIPIQGNNGMCVTVPGETTA